MARGGGGHRRRKGVVYRFAWGRLWDTRAQEPGDSLEALAIHSVADRTSRRWGGLGEVVEVRHGEPGEGKGRSPFRIFVAAFQGSDGSNLCATQGVGVGGGGVVNCDMSQKIQ